MRSAILYAIAPIWGGGIAVAVGLEGVGGWLICSLWSPVQLPSARHRPLG